MTDLIDQDQLPADTRTLPNDTSAEQSALGAMLLSNEALGDIAAILNPADFYHPKHGTIFNTIVAMYGRGEGVDVQTVAVTLMNQGDLPRIGGTPYLYDLIHEVPVAANGTWYALRVQQLAADRRLIEAATRIQQIAYSPLRDADNPKHLQATQLLYNAISERAGETIVRLGDSIEATMRAIEAGPQYGIPTGFADLDRLTGGLGVGQLWLGGARPSIGKTTWVMDLTRSVAIHHGKPALIFSLEMSNHELTMRLLSAESGVPFARLRAGYEQLDDRDLAALAKAQGRIENAPLYLDDTAGLSLVDIATRSRRLAAQEQLGLIVVDHIHIVAGSGGNKNDTRNLELGRISGGLKVLAKDLGTTVAAAAQLNRGPEQRADKRPTMADLRDSGNLEQDADVIVLLHRDDYYDKETPRAGEADFIVAKNRNGATDTVTVSAQLHLSRFTDMAIN